MQTLAQDPPAKLRSVLLRPSLLPGIFKCEFSLSVCIDRFLSSSLFLAPGVCLYIFYLICDSFVVIADVRITISAKTISNIMLGQGCLKAPLKNYFHPP